MIEQFQYGNGSFEKHDHIIVAFEVGYKVYYGKRRRVVTPPKSKSW